jgi:phage recombination protein Bet
MAEKKTKTKAVTKPGSQSTELLKLTPQNVVQYINPRASKEEVILFLNQCHMFGLNPFKREIYLIKYSKDDHAQFVVGYETYLKRADRSQKWDGISFGTEGSGSDLKAWCKVYRKDWKEPLVHEVDFVEYAQYKKGGGLNRFWEQKPKTMLKKVVIAQALRMAFPDEFAGMPYIVEEVNDIDMHSLPDGLERYNETKQVEDNFKKEDLKKEEERPVPAQFPDEEKEKETAEDEKERASQSMKMEINRLMATLVDNYNVTPEQILEKMDEKIGAHNVNELTAKQANELIDFFKWAIAKFEEKRSKEEHAKA